MNIKQSSFKKELTLSVPEDCLKLKEMSVKISIWISIKHDQISVCDLTFFVFVENNAQFYLHFFFYMIMNMENSVIKNLLSLYRMLYV